MTWLCAATAAAINYLGHVQTSPDGAIVLAVLSAAGIVVWEIRSGATHRAALRAKGMLPDPPASFGWRRWVRFLPSTGAAWSVDVRDRVSPRASHLLRVAGTERRTRTAEAERKQVRRLAQRAVRAAVRRGDTSAVLASLTWLAAHGTPRPVPALPTGDQPPPAQDQTSSKTVGTAPGQDRTCTDLPVPCHPKCQPGPDGTAAQDRTGAHCDSGPADGGPDDGAPRPGRSTVASPLAAASARGDSPVPSTAPAGPAVTHPPARPPVRKRRPTTEGFRTAPSDPTTKAGTGPRRAPDVSDLLPAGLRVRDRLAAHGVPLSRRAGDSSLLGRNNLAVGRYATAGRTTESSNSRLSVHLLRTAPSPANAPDPRGGGATLDVTALRPRDGAQAHCPVLPQGEVLGMSDWLKVTVSGSFHSSLQEIRAAVETWQATGAEVLSPADPRVVAEFAEFLFVASDRLRVVKLVQDRHLAAIRASDCVWLIAPEGYVGLSASMEIGFAAALNVPVFCRFEPRDRVIRQYVQVVPSVSELVQSSLLRRARRFADDHETHDLLLDPRSTVDFAHQQLDIVEALLTTDLHGPRESDSRAAAAATRVIESIDFAPGRNRQVRED